MRDVIKITINKNAVKITANIGFPNLNDQGQTVKNIISGIESYWSGNFKVWGHNITLTTKVNIETNTHMYAAPSALIYFYNKQGVSHVTWPLFGWRKGNVGKMTLYKGDSRVNVDYSNAKFQWVAAHEFGHLLGVRDNYTCPASKQVKSIMNVFGTNVQNIDVEKVLLAFSKNKLQGW